MADLELLRDNDLKLARHERSFTPPMYLQPTDAQRQRLRTLIGDLDLPRNQLLDLSSRQEFGM